MHRIAAVMGAVILLTGGLWAVARAEDKAGVLDKKAETVTMVGEFSWGKKKEKLPDRGVQKPLGPRTTFMRVIQAFLVPDFLPLRK